MLAKLLLLLLMAKLSAARRVRYRSRMRWLSPLEQLGRHRGAIGALALAGAHGLTEAQLGGGAGHGQRSLL
jgi:hypothetical protein